MMTFSHIKIVVVLFLPWSKFVQGFGFCGKQQDEKVHIRSAEFDAIVGEIRNGIAVNQAD